MTPLEATAVGQHLDLPSTYILLQLALGMTPQAEVDWPAVFALAERQRLLGVAWRRSAETIRAAREFASNAPPEMINQMPDMETAPVAPLVSLVRFGRWDEVLAYPAPPREWPYTSGVWHYARGMAFNAKGQADAAAGELRALDAIIQSVPPDRTLAFFFRSKNMLQLAANVFEQR